LPDGLQSVEPFDFDLMPDSLRPWAADICERIQCPGDFVAVGIMAGLGAVIGRKVGIRPQARTDWTVTANQWGLIVGRPGVLKSPALEAALSPLKRLAAMANQSFDKDLADYEIATRAAKLKAEAGEKEARKRLASNPGANVLDLLTVDEITEPTMKRYMANDSTPAALGELLRHNPNGLLVFRDEIVSLLRGLDREDQAEGRGFYLTGWNGDSGYTFDRIGRGMNLHIEAVCLSLLGGTQPGRLAEYVRQAVKGGAADDGLIQRFGLMVWPDTGGAWKDVDRWPDTDAKKAANDLFERLDNLTPAEIGAEQDTDQDGRNDGIPYLRFDGAALELFIEWRTDLETRLRSGDLHPALESHLAKYRKLIPGLALISHLADGGTGPVTESATLRALAWGEYLESHAKRVYGSGTQPDTDTAKAILARIRNGDLKSSFSSRDVWRNGWAKLADRDQVAAGLRLLVDYDWLFEDRLETGGRPATVYHVNPGGLR
jgi:putative DNA primase/helicase